MSDSEGITELSTMVDAFPALPGFQMIRLLGKGGMGQVYMARQLDVLDRDVAIKMVLSHRTEPYFHKRFLEEGQRQAELHHPNILPIFAAGEYQDCLYLVMHYARDGSLRDRLRAGPLPLEDAVAIGTQIVKALRHAHHEQDKPLVHLDIKPENILFDGDNALLSDFGIARKLEEDGRPTTVVAGDPRYWAPEQERNAATSRSDIFAFGTMFYELITGDRPSQAFRVITDRGSRRRLIRSVPGPGRKYAALIADCLQEDPTRRPTAEQLLESLTQLSAPVTSWARVATIAVGVLAVAGLVAMPATREHATAAWRQIFPLPVHQVAFSLEPPEAELWLDGVEQPFRVVSVAEGEHRIAVLADGYIGSAQRLSVQSPMDIEIALEPRQPLSDQEYLDFSRRFGVEDIALDDYPHNPTLLTLVELDQLSESSSEALEQRVEQVRWLAEAGDYSAATALFYAAFEGVEGVGSPADYLVGLNAASDSGYALASILGALHAMQALLDEGQTFNANPQVFSKVVERLQLAYEQGLPQTAALAAASAGIQLSEIP